MLDEHHFHAIANATLMHLFDQLEQAYDDGTLEELELLDGVLTIECENGKTFVVSRHEPSRQMWLASPISGGLHFDYDHDNGCWKLSDGRILKQLLAQELNDACGLHIVF